LRKSPDAGEVAADRGDQSRFWGLTMNSRDWFGANLEFLLYDATGTSLDGGVERIPPAPRGCFRDQPGCNKTACIILVCTLEGLPSGLEVFSVNRADARNVGDIVRVVETEYGRAGRVCLVDRGTVSKENMASLRKREGQTKWVTKIDAWSHRSLQAARITAGRRPRRHLGRHPAAASAIVVEKSLQKAKDRGFCLRIISGPDSGREAQRRKRAHFLCTDSGGPTRSLCGTGVSRLPRPTRRPAPPKATLVRSERFTPRGSSAGACSCLLPRAGAGAPSRTVDAIGREPAPV
jgi:hypothetical protein